MGIDLTEAFADGTRAVATPAGAGVAGTFVGIAIAHVVVYQTILLRIVERVLDLAGVSWSTVVAELPPTVLLVVGPQASAGPAVLFPNALEVSLIAAVGVWIGLSLVTEAARVVAIRVFAYPGDGLPDDWRDGIALATINSVVARLVSLVVVGLGTLLLILPGIVAGIALTFVRQEVALRGSNALAALGDSYEDVKGDFLTVFAIGILLLVLSILVGQVGGTGVAPAFTPAVLASLVGVYQLSVLTDAYRQATTDGVTGGEPSRSPDGATA